ncbi:MAG: PepSY domain-containing protein [Gammaproteobacteria bacterium]|nr:PepSY domain-containing protein [Gammaproteobacteria bacterium]
MKKILIPTLLITCISLTVAYASDHKSKKYDNDHKNAHELVNSGNILPLEKILETVYKTQQGKILEVELERENNGYIYEIEILDNNNKVWEMEINAVTGQLLKVEEED